MAVPNEITLLAQRFARNRDAYESSRYNETQARIEFLDPFFKALGWDIDNTSGYAEAYKDVVHEYALKTAGGTKAPDYCFRVGGVRKFFLEAKRPALDISDDRDSAYQLRRYGWSAKLPISVLSNFRSLSVYDCRIRPNAYDKASTARIMQIPYEEYESRWEEISAIFSKEAIYKGSFDKYADSDKNKKGTAEVDDEFLKEIESWRDLLSRNIAARNSSIDSRGLNYAVQQTIDRIIFLRICEDRGIEPYGNLQALLKGDQTHKRLQQYFRIADERYNSGLFHFQDEKGRKSPPDRLTPTLQIDDKPLKQIFERLYYPDSPYEFSVLPADILGQVYEQFLGRVIELNSRGQVRINEKPEIKKAGGIYYTPGFIVDYIVRKTVGARLDKASLRSVKDLTIIDPACGSGSFLLAAYEQLLQWYLNSYVEDGAEQHARGRPPRLFKNEFGQWRLTTIERKRILLQHVYGVDIDLQATEVTKLSLLLKVLEDESAESLGKTFKMFHERALPDLDDNIKCGNSLVDSDFYTGRIEFDEDERYRINAFDWRAEYSQVFQRGGFDIVLGNPPYRRELDYKELLAEIASTSFGRRYRTARMDLWYYFVHRGLELLKANGFLSYIVNAYWMSGTGAERLIADMRAKSHLDEIFYLGKLQVFRKVSGQHMLFKITKGLSQYPTKIKITASSAIGSAEPYVTGRSSVLEFDKSEAQLFRSGKLDIQPSSDSLLQKLELGIPLRDLGTIRQGIAENPAAINRKTNDKFGDKWVVGQGVFVLQNDEVAALGLDETEKSLLRPYHELRDLGRYRIRIPASAQIIYSTRATCPNIQAFPGIRDHLKQFRQIMDERRETLKGSNKWWHLHWPRDESIWASAKILSIQMGSRPAFVPVMGSAYVSFSVNVFVPRDRSRENINYVTAVLNSRVLWKWFAHHAKRRGTGLEINGHVLESAPIKLLDPTLPAEQKMRQIVTSLVDQMVNLVSEMENARMTHEKQLLQRQIALIDAQLDSLICDIYGLSSEEIRSLANNEPSSNMPGESTSVTSS